MYYSCQSISIAAEVEPLSMVNASSERLYALDAARATALLLGIVFHATMSREFTSSGISSGDVLILPERHPARRRRESRDRAPVWNVSRRC
jgi:hypothetical protein